MDPGINPYESPSASDADQVALARQALGWRVGLPGLCLIVVGVLHLIVLLLVFAVVIAALNRDQPLVTRNHWLFYGMLFVFSLPAVLSVMAGRRMWQMRSLWFCRIAAIVACIPYLSPGVFAGIPFGIWATIVLAMPSTAAAFDEPGGP